MPPSTSDRLKDIADMITKIDSLTGGMTTTDFSKSETIRAAVERYLGIACEASLRLPAEMKQGHADIDWRAMNDFANLLRHGYHAVSVDQVWNIVQHHLPRLQAFVKQALVDREGN